MRRDKECSNLLEIYQIIYFESIFDALVYYGIKYLLTFIYFFKIKVCLSFSFYSCYTHW